MYKGYILNCDWWWEERTCQEEFEKTKKRALFHRHYPSILHPVSLLLFHKRSLTAHTNTNSESSNLAPLKLRAALLLTLLVLWRKWMNYC